MQKKSLALVGVLLLSLFSMAASCSAEIDFDDWDDFADRYRYTETVHETLVFTGKQLLNVDNPVGSVKIEMGTAETIELWATKQSKKFDDLAKIYLDIRETARSIDISSKHTEHKKNGKWAIEYILRVPAGMGINIDQGVGNVRVADYRNGHISIGLGVGEVEMQNVHLSRLDISLGVGNVDLYYVESREVTASVGTGDLHLALRPDASFVIDADVGMGDLSVTGFSQMSLNHKGFIAQSVHGVIGSGGANLRLHVGVGELKVNALEAEKP